MDEIIVDKRKFAIEGSAIDVASDEKKLVVLVYERELDEKFYRVFTREEFRTMKKLNYGIGFCTLTMAGWMSIKHDFTEKTKKGEDECIEVSEMPT